MSAPGLPSTPILVRGADAGTLLAAIRAKCLDCCGGSRSLVAACRSPECALYPYRNRTACAQVDMYDMLSDERSK